MISSTVYAREQCDPNAVDSTIPQVITPVAIQSRQLTFSLSTDGAITCEATQGRAR